MTKLSLHKQSDAVVRLPDAYPSVQMQAHASNRCGRPSSSGLGHSLGISHSSLVIVKHSLVIFLFPLFFFLCVLPSLAQSPAKKLSYDNFRYVRTRNIFDPDRRAMIMPQSGGAAGGASSKPVTKSDYAALTGTMITPEKSLAFFSGSRDDFNKVLPVKGSIAGVTILKVSTEGIEVDRNGKHITVAIGQTVPLDDSAPAPAPTPDASASVPAPGSSQSSSPGAPPSNVSDVMKRMMERRQQELK